MTDYEWLTITYTLTYKPLIFSLLIILYHVTIVAKNCEKLCETFPILNHSNSSVGSLSHVILKTCFTSDSIASVPLDEELPDSGTSLSLLFLYVRVCIV